MATPTTLMGLFVIMATLLIGAKAETYTVGGRSGWTIPSLGPVGPVTYTAWAAGKLFHLGDTIVFNWNSTHTVAIVSKEAYDSCNTNNTLAAPLTTSPVNFTIDTNSTQYYICTLDSDCILGQKVTITVFGSSIGQSSAASSVTATALSAIALAMAISFLSFM